MSTTKPHRARKRFGQNFLQDANVIQDIITAIKPLPEQHIVEIGPGLGAITEFLLEQSGKLDAIELDRDLAALLVEKYANHSGFTLHQADVLKFDFNQLSKRPRSLRIVGNLPYNISTPCLFHLLKFYPQIQDMVFMLQLEVVKRLAAKVGNKNYGRLGLMVQYYCRIEALFEVPAGAFRPQPKVTSAIVKLTPHQSLPIEAKNILTLQQVIRSAFSQRRKTLSNSLKTLVSPQQLQSLDIDIKQRPENIDLADYVKISDLITEGTIY